MTEAIAKCEKYKIPYLGPSFKPQIFWMNRITNWPFAQFSEQLTSLERQTGEMGNLLINCKLFLSFNPYLSIFTRRTQSERKSFSLNISALIITMLWNANDSKMYCVFVLHEEKTLSYCLWFSVINWNEFHPRARVNFVLFPFIWYYFFKKKLFSLWNFNRSAVY